MKNIILTIFIVFCGVPFAQARVCEVPNACGNTITPQIEAKYFSTYKAFNTWTLANPDAQFEIVYATSSGISIEIFSNLRYTEQCWDRTGECTLPITP